MSIKQKLTRRLAKTTARHTAHGAASKLKREPVRTTTLLGAGAALGAAAVWLVGRSTAGPEAAS